MARAAGDFGDAPTNAKRQRLIALGVGGLGVLGLGLFAAWTMATDNPALNPTAAKPAPITGAPCPTVADGRFTEPMRPSIAFRFNDVAFTRALGHADCSGDGTATKNAPPVCQFSGPAELIVKTAGATAYFEPGAGKSVTVSIVNGTPKCVMASPYWDDFYHANGVK